MISLKFKPGRTSCLPEVFPKTSGPSEPLTFAFLGASTPWVYALAVALAEKGHATAAVAVYDWGDLRRMRPSWPAGKRPLRLNYERWALPTGYVGALASFFAPILRAKLRVTLARLERHCGASRRKTAWIVVPYPWFAEALRGFSGERLIYLNLDDYRLYHPARAGKIDQQETEMVRRSALTLCLSQQQVNTLQTRHSEKSIAIRHFPLGVAKSYLNLTPKRVPTWKTVGYIGNLMDRVDWRLVVKAASALPEINFLFLGSLEVPCGGGCRSNWKRERALQRLPCLMCAASARCRRRRCETTTGILTFAGFRMRPITHLIGLPVQPRLWMDWLAADQSSARIFPNVGHIPIG